MIKTRFAPSPTGKLHLGGARTALFNWLYGRGNNGLFYLRIDDTDQKRSHESFVEDIKTNLTQLKIHWDGKEIYQSHNVGQHLRSANEMLNNGTAYYCSATREEINIFCQNNPGKKFISPYRNQHLANISGTVLRLKVPLEGTMVLRDKVLGSIITKNNQIDDPVLVRSDGSPTYILSSSVDDNNMEITHVIRGNDHLANTFKQLHIIKSLGWKQQNFAHIPLILNQKGEKLSKRDGNFGLNHYLDQGYLPAALNNYFLRLGWSHSNNGMISIEEAKKSFSLANINKSPARFDQKKLTHINQMYLKQMDDKELLAILVRKLNIVECPSLQLIIKNSMPLIKNRGETIQEILNLSKLYINDSVSLDQDSKILLDTTGLKILNEIKIELIEICTGNWKIDLIKETCQNYINQNNIKTITLMKVIRAAIFGTLKSPPLFESMQVLGKLKTIERLFRCCEES